MLEVGWSEILVIALILIIVVGPKDLPQMLRTFGKMATRLRGMANEFKGQFDEALREADLDDVRKGLSEVTKLNPTNSLRDAINPIRKLGEDIKADLRKASDMSTPAAASTEGAVTESASTDSVFPGDIAAAMPSAAAVSPSPVVAALQPDPAAPVIAAPVTKTRKAAVKTKDAAVAAVAAEAMAKKPATRKKAASVTELVPDPGATASAKPKKTAARKKTENTGDA
jgi:sec-independent protein translocase protein TatB